jgi:predicted PurR-regulated permease PerM
VAHSTCVDGEGAIAGGQLTPSVLYRAVLLAFALVVVILVFPEFAGLILLAMLVAVVAVPMSSATDRLERLGLPRGVGAPLVLLAVIGVIVGIVALIVPAIVSQSDRFVSRLPSLVDQVRQDLGRATHSPPSRLGQDAHNFASDLTSHPQQLLGPAAAVGAGVAGTVTALVVVAITALYSAISPKPLVRGALRLVPPARRDHAHHILRRLAHSYVGWLRGLLIGMLVLGVIVYLGLLAIGIPFAILFAALTAVAMVVPYFGALVSSIPPILLALTISPTKALLVAVLYIAAHQFDGHVVEPLVMSRAVNLHPAVIAIGVIGVERLFGFLGLIVAVPLLVTFKILVEELWVRPAEARHGGREPPGDGRLDSAADHAHLQRHPADGRQAPRQLHRGDQPVGGRPGSR